MLANVFLYKTGCTSLSKMKCFEIVFVLVSVAKIVLWAGVELNMVSDGLISYCSGGIYAYLLTITIIHIIVAVIITLIAAALRLNCRISFLQ